jgi:hypothetical protein
MSIPLKSIKSNISMIFQGKDYGTMWFSFGFTFWGKFNKFSSEILVHFFLFQTMGQCGFEKPNRSSKKLSFIFLGVEVFCMFGFFLRVGILFAFIL